MTCRNVSTALLKSGSFNASRAYVKLNIHHRTCYRYAAKVAFGPHELMFRPRENHAIRLEKFELKISPRHRLRWVRDVYENNVGLLDVAETASELAIESESILDISEDNPFDFIIAPGAIEYPFFYDHETQSEVAAFCKSVYPRDTDRVRDWLHSIWHLGRRLGTLELLQQLNKTIYRDFRYQRRERRGVQTPAETMEIKSGSCRDFATLFIESCRFLSLAARFVSGYMYHSEISGRMSMHSWAEVYIPGAGWLGFDPSWGILADSSYIPVAVARHPEHVPPISGTYFGTQRDYLRTDVDLYVRKMDEALSPTLLVKEIAPGKPKPLTLGQHQAQSR